jgi:hypothetical protein
MSKSVTGELKMVITTTIDELFDAVRAEKISIADATIALQNQLNDIEGSIYTLNKKYLVRAFTVLGVSESEIPSMKSGGEIPAAREIFKNYLFPGENQAEINHSDEENQELDHISVHSDVEAKTPEQKTRESTKKTSNSTGIRASPRTVPSLSLIHI